MPSINNENCPNLLAVNKTQYHLITSPLPLKFLGATRQSPTLNAKRRQMTEGQGQTSHLSPLSATLHTRPSSRRSCWHTAAASPSRIRCPSTSTPRSAPSSATSCSSAGTRTRAAGRPPRSCSASAATVRWAVAQAISGREKEVALSFRGGTQP